MKDTFVIYRSLYDAIKPLPKELQADAWTMVMEYGLNGIEPNVEGILLAIFTLVKPNIDSSTKRYKASVENGKKGGAPKGTTPWNKGKKNEPNTNLTQTQHEPKLTKDEPTSNLNVNVNVNDNVNDNVNVNVNDTGTGNEKKFDMEDIDMIMTLKGIDMNEAIEYLTKLEETPITKITSTKKEDFIIFDI